MELSGQDPLIATSSRVGWLATDQLLVALTISPSLKSVFIFVSIKHSPSNRFPSDSVATSTVIHFAWLKITWVLSSLSSSQSFSSPSSSSSYNFRFGVSWGCKPDSHRKHFWHVIRKKWASCFSDHLHRNHQRCYFYHLQKNTVIIILHCILFIEASKLINTKSNE